MPSDTLLSTPVEAVGAQRPRRPAVAAAALLLVALSGTALYWAARMGSRSAGLQSIWPGDGSERRITVQARDQEVGQVLREVASQAGAVPAVDPSIVGKMSIATRDARLEDLMNDLCTAYSCRWSLSATSPRTLTVQPAAPSTSGVPSYPPAR